MVYGGTATFAGIGNTVFGAPGMWFGAWLSPVQGQVI